MNNPFQQLFPANATPQAEQEEVPVAHSEFPDTVPEPEELQEETTANPEEAPFPGNIADTSFDDTWGGDEEDTSTKMDTTEHNFFAGLPEATEQMEKTNPEIPPATDFGTPNPFNQTPPTQQEQEKEIQETDLDPGNFEDDLPQKEAPAGFSHYPQEMAVSPEIQKNIPKEEFPEKPVEEEIPEKNIAQVAIPLPTAIPPKPMEKEMVRPERTIQKEEPRKLSKEEKKETALRLLSGMLANPANSGKPAHIIMQEINTLVEEFHKSF